MKRWKTRLLAALLTAVAMFFAVSGLTATAQIVEYYDFDVTVCHDFDGDDVVDACFNCYDFDRDGFAETCFEVDHVFAVGDPISFNDPVDFGDPVGFDDPVDVNDDPVDFNDGPVDFDDDGPVDF